MPARASRPVLAAGLSACLILSATLTMAVPAAAGDTRLPELIFAGELVHDGQTTLDHVIVVIDELIDRTSIPAKTAFELIINGALPENPAKVEFAYEGFAGPNFFLDGPGLSFLRLELSTPVVLSDIVTFDLRYIPDPLPDATNIQDLALNEAVETTIAVETGSIGGMDFIGGMVDYEHGTDRVLLVFNQPIDLSSIPAPDDFTVKVNTAVTPVQSVQTPMPNVGLGFIDLVLPLQLDGSQTVSVTYTPNPDPLLPRLLGRFDGQAAPGFEDQPITYFVPLNTTSGTVTARDPVTTFYGDGPTATDPLATTVQWPNEGQVSITEQPLIDQTNAGYTYFGQQVLITVEPDATDASQPWLITFDLHESLVPDGEDAQSIAILRDDVPVPKCDAIAPEPAVASPPPCVWQRVDQTGGGISITVATLQASRWNFGRPTYSTVFDGFRPPVDNAPIRNGMKAGGAVALKFSLGGDRGLAIFAAGSPSSQPVDCDPSVPYDGVEQTATVTAGGSSLSYHPASDTYAYVWKTQKGWTGCRKLTLTFADGSVQEAIFQFRP